MAKLKKNFYIGKGESDTKPWLFYGFSSPCFIHGCICPTDGCTLISQFTDNPIADSIKNNEVIKIYIRRETIKVNKK